MAQGSAAQAAGPQQQQHQQQQQPQSASSAHTSQTTPPAKKKKKNKKNKRSKAQQEKSFSKNKLADLLKKKEKELEEQKAKCAELEHKIKTVEEGLGSDDSDMEESAETGSEGNSSSNVNDSNNLSADTTKDPFVKPKPVVVGSPSKNSSISIDNNVPRTPARTSSNVPPVHGVDTPASRLCSVVNNCNIVTPAREPKSTENSNSEMKENGQDSGSMSTDKNKVSALSSISPISARKSDESISQYHKRSGFFKDINARYCSFSEKMKLDFDENGCYTCPRCEEKVQYYQKGDTIPLLLTTSTLARTHTDILHEEGVCSHFEIIELPGARIAEMSQIVMPIIEFLSEHNKVQVLCAVGVNDFLLRGNTLDNIFKDFENFSIAINQSAHKQNLNFKFIGIPLVPSLCKFKNDYHEIRRDMTADMVKYNDLIKSFNAQIDVLSFYVPTLMFKGIRKFSNDPFPENYHHVPECWEEWDREIPKKNCIHLADHVKRGFWSEIQRFFKYAVKK